MSTSKVFSLLIALILVGCSFQANQSVPIETTLENVAVTITSTDKPQVVTPYVTQIVSLTSTPYYSTETTISTIVPTSIPPLTSTASPEAHLDYQCFGKIAELPSGVYSGSLVLAGYDGPPDFLNLSTKETKVVGNEQSNGKLLSQTVSPGGDWLAYHNYQENILVVTMTNNSKTIKQNWEEDWFRLAGWINDQQIVIELKSPAHLVFNPFTGERKILLADFPDLAEPIGIGADWWGMAKYNSDLTQAVYPATAGRIRLWNLQTRQPVNELVSVFYPFGSDEPVWSPDGDAFVISLRTYDGNHNVLPEELYKISHDGQIDKITSLHEHYSQYLRISDYVWSPDASRIAFWLTHNASQDKTEQKRMAILNLKTMQVIEYCVKGDVAISESLAWSPDGKYLAVMSLNDDRYDHSILLMDFEKKLMYPIAADFLLVGWLK